MPGCVVSGRVVSGLGRTLCVALLTLLVSSRAQAQGLTPGPPGPHVIDVRGTTLGVPQKSIFYPAIPATTVIPARGFGLQAGAHVLPLAWGPRRIGFGAHVFLSRATAVTPTSTKTSTDPTTGKTITTPIEGPDIAVSTRLVMPEMTINFGTSRGWSYVGFGAGPIRVRSEAAGVGVLTTTKVSGSVAGGARWFITDHLGVGFDLRLMTLSTRTIFGASAGLSFK